MRNLLAKGTGKEIIFTHYGRLLTAASGAKHGFTPEFDVGHQKHEARTYVPSPLGDKSKISSGNVFQPLAHPAGLGGPLDIAFQCHADVNQNTLTARKPWGITTEDIPLKKGKPVKLAWVPSEPKPGGKPNIL